MYPVFSLETVLLYITF